MADYLKWFNELSSDDIALVGGKNASLGELMRLGANVPEGFAVTSHAYDKFIQTNGLTEFIERQLADVDVNDVEKLEIASKGIREKILEARFPKDLEDSIIDSYEKLCKLSQNGNVSCAVRSSATAEDLPTASFAGQQETFLNVKGRDILEKIKECFGSLFTSRAIFYRRERGFNGNVKMSVGVQRLVNSEKSGVIFTIEPNSGNDNILVIDSSYGLGELVVSGKVIPDQFYVFKPSMQLIRSAIADKMVMLVPDGSGTKDLNVPETDRYKPSLTANEIKSLSEQAISIQKHYNRSMDIEWAIENGSVYILQARPETVHSNAVLEDTYRLEETGRELVKGIAIGRKIAVGKIKILKDPSEMHKFNHGDILVTRMTTPNWVPIMNKSSAIITEEGGTTSHAAIVSRELGVPCVVGAANAIKTLSKYENREITVDCSEGIGRIYEGRLEFVKEVMDLRKLPKTKTQIMMNISIPDAALHHANKCEGVGLLRLEFVYAHEIGIHPLALINYKQLKEKVIESDGELKKTLLAIDEKTKGYESKEDYFIQKLSDGISVIAAAVYPNDVVVRFSDFKTNEYRGLTGGYLYESEEANPMLGWRGASRYVHPAFEPAFRLECRAIKSVRGKGLKNIIPEIPFCRTTRELARVLKIMEEEGLRRGDDLKVCLMAEVPSNIWNAEEFCKYVDEFSIGSNDLTQLTLGVDRDSGSMAGVTFDERDVAVKIAISYLIKIAHKNGKKVGICGQAPSDYPEFVEFLIKEGIDSISLNPDVIGKTRKLVAKIEDRMMIRPVNLRDCIVFLRVDMNSPVDKTTGKFLDEHRINDGVSAMGWCFENGADVVVAISHQGRKKEDTLKNHIPVIERYFPNKVKFVGNISNLPQAIKDAKRGDILLLENVRSLDEEKDYTDVGNTVLYKTFKEVEKITNKKLVYAKDDLAVSHRKDLSVYGLPMQLRKEGYEVVAGQLIKNELVRARMAKEKMQKSNVIGLWGGGKFEDYLHLFEPFLISYKNSVILTAGPLALLMIRATGKDIGENEKLFGITDEFIGKASEIMRKYGDRVITPKDFYVENSNGKELVGVDNLNGLIVDIGPETVQTYRNIVSGHPNSVIIGNGPLGEYEKLPNAKGTIQVYTEVFNPLNKHFVIGGGGDFNTMMDILGFKPDMRSSGGKAFLELLVFGTLPGLEPLELSVE